MLGAETEDRRGRQTANSGVSVLTETGAVGALGTTWVSAG